MRVETRIDISEELLGIFILYTFFGGIFISAVFLVKLVHRKTIWSQPILSISLQIGVRFKGQLFCFYQSEEQRALAIGLWPFALLYLYLVHGPFAPELWPR